MNPTMKRPSIRLLAAGLLAIAAAAPLHAIAQDGPPYGGHDRHGGPFLHELRELNLSDAQRQTIHGYLETARDSARAEFRTLHSLRRAFDTAIPGSSSYATAVAQLADAEAKAASERVQKMAALRGQIYAVLTDAQKSLLASKLAALPAPPEPL